MADNRYRPLSLGDWLLEGIRGTAPPVVFLGDRASWLEKGLGGKVPVDYIAQLPANAVTDRVSSSA